MNVKTLLAHLGPSQEEVLRVLLKYKGAWVPFKKLAVDLYGSSRGYMAGNLRVYLRRLLQKKLVERSYYWGYTDHGHYRQMVQWRAAPVVVAASRTITR